MTAEEMGASNNNIGKPLPHSEIPQDHTSVAILDFKNKFGTLRTENKNINVLNEKVKDMKDFNEPPEKPPKDIESGTKICDLCDFETAITATGYGKYNVLLLFCSSFGFLACINSTSTMSLILPSAECHLDLSNFDKGILNAIVYVGMIFSAFIWGFLSDSLGRKKLLVIGFAAEAFFATVVGLAQDFTVLLIAKLFSGFISSGPYAIMMTYLSESHAAKYRASILVWTGIFSAAGTVGLPMLAWLIIPQDINIDIFEGLIVLPSWRVFLLVSTIPAFIASFLLHFFDESPKFLMSRGRREEALEVFKKIYWINTGKPRDTYPINSLKKECKEKFDEEEPKTLSDFLKSGWNQTIPLFQRPHLPYALLVFVIQFGTLYGLNTIRLWIPQLFSSIINNEKIADSGFTPSTVCQLLVAANSSMTNETQSCDGILVEDRVYINSMVIGVTTAIGYLTSGYLVRALGKKWLMILAYIIGGSCCMAMYWSTSSDIMLGVTSVFVTVCSVASTAIVSAVVDLFPTSLRTMAVSLTMMFGRVGAMLGNLIFPLLLDWDCSVPFFLLGSVIFATAAITLLLPKTKGKALE